MKILTILGARPQFIKASILSNYFKDDNYFDEIIVHTGQHFDSNMSNIFFKELNIPNPKYNLNVNNVSPSQMISNICKEMTEIINNEKPEYILVYGDTNSTLAGAISAKHHNIKCIHVEAGLRSYNKQMPEEFNRCVTDYFSHYLFCPSKNSFQNLDDDYIKGYKYIVGDVMYDLFLKTKNFITDEILEKNKILKKKYILLTIHRAENTLHHEQLLYFLNFLNEEISKYNMKIVFPIHPRSFNLIKNSDILNYQNIKFIEPVSYLDMISLERNSLIIMTDSGGVQKEAYWNKIPCITLRNETEWVETIHLGCNKLTGLNHFRVSKTLNYFLEKNIELKFKEHIYGDGFSGQKIFKILKEL